jgi:hypothetical protein
MAHLWVKGATGEWEVFPLAGCPTSLAERPPRVLAGAPDGVPEDAGVLLLRCAGAGSPEWLLLTRPGVEVQVNGLPLALGIRRLGDRDEIWVRGVGTFHFSVEELAAVESFQGAEQAIFCPRCRQEIAPGTAAVRCPCCGVWHHQHDELPCWSYAEHCALCPQVTDLESGYRWIPEEV